MYDEPIDVAILSKKIGDVEQVYTQHAGVRPFGVSLIFGGVDKVGSKVFQTDPSGACWSYKAVSIGAGSDTVRDILEVDYKEDSSLEETIQLAMQCFSKVIEGRLEAKNIKIAIIPVTTKKFTVLTHEEVAKYIKKIK
jgi:proteasome alpha subunit